MPQTSFVVGCSSIGLSDENKTDCTSSYSNPVIGPAAQWLAILPESLRGLVGLPLEAMGGGSRRAQGGLTWPQGVSVAALERGLWNLSLAAENASCLPHIANS